MRTNYKNKLASLSVIVMMASSILISCQKNLPVDGLENFNVTTDSVSYKAGTSVRFVFQGGEAQDISFYSGETLKGIEYLYLKIKFVLILDNFIYYSPKII